MQKRCKQTLRMQSLFQTLCHEIPQKATRKLRSNTKRTSKAWDQNKAFIPFYNKQSWQEDISNNEKCNLCSYSENTGRERHTGEGFREKVSIFTHPKIGTTCPLTTSANWQKLARLAHWQLAPMASWRGLLTENKRQRLKMKKQRISPNQD